MYFLHVDESGQTAIKPNKADNGLYVLTGIVSHEKDRKHIEERLGQLKRKLLGNITDGWELHAHEIWNNRDFFSKKESNLDLDKKIEIFSKTVDLVAASDIVLISTVVRKDRAKDMHQNPRILQYSWTFLSERFEHFLKSKPSGTNTGLILMDDSPGHQSDIKSILSNLVDDGSYWHTIDHIIEYPIFVKSHKHNMIQLADMIAYIIHKHYKRDRMFGDWFEKLKPKIHAPGGKTRYGIKEFP